MAKPSRRPHRNLRAKGMKAGRSPALATRAADGGLHLVVATAPGGGVQLEHEMRLVRAALLYADTVEFMSPTAQMLALVSEFASQGLEGFASLLQQMDDQTATHILGEMDKEAMLEGVRLMEQAAGMTRAQRRQHMSADFRAELRATEAGIAASMAEISEIPTAAGLPELADAINSGALSLNLDMIKSADVDTDEVIERFIELLKDRLETPGVHLLLDEQMASIARHMISEGVATPSEVGLSRALRTGVGTGLISHLPAFPDAKVSDILEARDELRDPLSAYRSGMKSIEHRLAAQAFDPEMPSEIDELWRDEVDPTIRRLRKDLSKPRSTDVLGGVS